MSREGSAYSLKKVAVVCKELQEGSASRSVGHMTNVASVLFPQVQQFLQHEGEVDSSDSKRVLPLRALSFRFPQQLLK